MAEAPFANIPALVLLVVGASFMVLAAVGVVRMPDVFMRMQATSKAATLGVGCMMLAVAVHFADLAVATRAAAVILFTFLTAPIGAHMIGRAAYIAKARLWEGTLRNDLEPGHGSAADELLRGERRPPDATGNGGEIGRRRSERHYSRSSGAEGTVATDHPIRPPDHSEPRGGARTPDGGEP